MAQGPPIFTDSAFILGLSGRAVRTFGKFTSKENGSVYIQPEMIPYSFSNNFLMGISAPFLRIDPNNMSSENGIGDVSLFSKLVVYRKDGLRKTFRSALKLKETFPSGDDGGNTPIGLGAFQTHLALLGDYVTTNFGIFSEIGYTVKGNNIDDDLIYNIGFGYPFLPQRYPPKQISAYLELNGRTVLNNKKNINVILISPRLQIIPNRRILFETGLQIPIKDDNPKSNEINIVFLLGTRFLIF